jgi:pyruvate, water dikinase
VSGRYVMWFSDCERSSIDQVGGKAAGLGELLKAGVRVPAGFAITAGALSDLLAREGLGERIDRRLEEVDAANVKAAAAASEGVRGLLGGAELPADLRAEIVAGYRELCERVGAEEAPVAVRSSAVAEDLEHASFAGQLQTFLWVRGADAVVAHVVRCWAGFFSPEALAYRAKLGLSSGDAAMSVAVQQMVDAASSGVMFTVNPVNGDRSTIAIDSSWGLGEAVVSGEVTPDHFLVDKVTLDIVERTISPKTYELAFDPEKGTVEGRTVEEPRATQPAVSDDELRELAQLGKQIERHHGAPQDIEWAIERRDGESVVHLLQSRAETVWSRREGEAPQPAGGSATQRVLSDMLGRVGADRVLGDKRGGDR